MLPESIFSITSASDFKSNALEVFQHQFEHNVVYRSFCDLLYKNPSDIKEIEEIPFLPISFFKSHKVNSSKQQAEIVFSSSGTTGMQTSKHYVTDVSLYKKSYLAAFQQFYGNIEEYAILGLLPSYLERDGSSLIYMVHDLIEKSCNSHSGFYLHQLDALVEKIHILEESGQKTLLIGVSFALLDVIEKHSFHLKNTIIMETGGMKGKRKELVRDDLHTILKNGFGVSQIHSEYGMTELLSQAYSKENGIFECPSWMKVLTRDPEDPFSLVKNQTGGINIIDLANRNSCSFIATQDLGKVFPNGTFEVIGRFDTSDIRGCNLLIL
ncbi:MAG: acyl transferase [Flavobacteriaceae bacterium CG_4_8_14_3_um_filter_34_10]|nr:MAG: acyl transferase [Flavobacteriaceae bacterium CG2_30_34_30]PIQ17049.1 MAG: acyl transferase [Flavobacteriaceae bacterium CG18_big_fil_WC_8_21_14_2_50_34_36]PIV48711.1 MAG: acyl transferase [Flavobacteriaceae bacterium CG02_land_8_20_14_3_00_34_13]PIX09956.1 MAG: acyl transferase [Flavobacteriaceae bacterium CG_4_8_14_3_um_filter_34_10]PIZ08689.1 MAG: acyl transferase [Flavobacteriaceae bacterium CG_4_10_14_0_8_um_filter_34_31]PJC07367.1 MAG: acyl transferase [Flavobacteriaceae bacteriu